MGLVAAAVLIGLSTSLAQAVPPSWHRVDERGEVRVDLLVFWSTGCPHCRRAVRFIREDLLERLPWLDARLLELSEPGNLERYRSLAAALGVEAAYVPAFFYCGRAVHGYDQDATTGRFLQESLMDCRARIAASLADAGATEPAVSGREQLAEPGSPPPSIELPWLGTFDPAALSLPVMTVALAGMDAFNPCAFFVLLFLLSLMVHARSRTRMALVGGVFVLFSGLLYFLFMAAWLNLFLLVGFLPLVTTAAGLVALAVGVINIKDFVWFRQGVSLSIPERAKPGLYQRMRALLNASSLPAMLIGTVALALAANAYELLCTAGFPLVFTRILTLHELSAAASYGYLVLYNLIYVLPLLAIVVVFVITLGARRLEEEQGRALKLLSGLMMVGLGAILLLAPAWLNRPLTALALIAAAAVLTPLLVWLRRVIAQSGTNSAARP